MNEQEAKNTLISIFNTQAIPICKNFKEVGDCVNEALEIASTALEKQIAKKPYFEGDGYYNGQIVYDTWICPCCDKDYEVDYEEYEHCPSCGQKIDWSDENEM